MKPAAPVTSTVLFGMSSSAHSLFLGLQSQQLDTGGVGVAIELRPFVQKKNMTPPQQTLGGRPAPRPTDASSAYSRNSSIRAGWEWRPSFALTSKTSP